MKHDEAIKLAQEGNLPTITHRDVSGCACCGSKGPLEMNPKCHRGVPVRATLAGNFMLLRCSVCEQPVANFKLDMRTD